MPGRYHRPPPPVLGRTVRLPERDLQRLAETLDKSPNTLRSWEKGDEDVAIPLPALQMYQDFFGIPPGMTLTIARLAYLASQSDTDRLEAPAKILNTLAGRILRPGKHRDLTNLRDASESSALPDYIISELFDAVRREVNNTGGNVFSDIARGAYTSAILPEP
jgi:hypothetical protein